MLWIFIVIASVVSFYLGRVHFAVSLKDEGGNRLVVLIGEQQKQLQAKGELIKVLRKTIEEKEKTIKFLKIQKGEA